MKLVPFMGFPDPFEEMQHMMNDMVTPQGARMFAPALDMYQTNDAVVIETSLPGIEPKDVDISIEQDVLTIKGQSKKTSEVDEKNYYRKEMTAGSFYRSVALPTHVLEDEAKAEFDNGMLKIMIPKAPEVKAKKINVHVVNK